MATVAPKLDQAELRRRARARRRGERFGRGDMSAVGRWFWEIDRVLLLLVTLLIGIGLIAVAAAAPAAAVRYSGGTFTMAPRHYFWLQLAWTGVAVPVMLGVSMLPKPTARRFAIAGAALFTLLLMLVPVMGVAEKNGAQRWIFHLQPSEFLKPFFVVTIAWLLSLKAKDGKLPVAPLSFAYLAVIAGFLMKQPDFGQTVMFLLMWTALLTLSGAPMKGLAILAGSGIAVVILAYLFYPVAHLRIDNFLFQTGDTYQVDSAYRTITHGGLIGTGPGAGTMKFQLPEAHTDYIFSVIGEEFGLVACVAIAAIYLAIVVRVFLRLLREEDNFLMLASAGLVTQFGLQALINMLVNVRLAPSKGMTLPFISYGGSSMIALSIGFGLLLAFTRSNPFLKRSPYVVTWSGQ
jgi:cell division protein FtsW